LLLSSCLFAQTQSVKPSKLAAPEPQLKDYKTWETWNDAHTRWIVDQEAGLSSGSAGRFQLFFSPHARADVYLVDTATGRIWKPITMSNAKDANFKTAPELWVYQDRVDNEQEFDSWATVHSNPTVQPASDQSKSLPKIGDYPATSIDWSKYQATPQLPTPPGKK
jgi:hypothetical protein